MYEYVCMYERFFRQSATFSSSLPIQSGSASSQQTESELRNSNSNNNEERLESQNDLQRSQPRNNGDDNIFSV